MLDIYTKKGTIKKLDITKMEHMFGIIDYNIKLPYKFRTYTEIKIFDRTEKKTETLKIDNNEHITILKYVRPYKVRYTYK